MLIRGFTVRRGLIYVTATARILYAMCKIGYVPKFLSKLNHQHFPVWAIAVNFCLGMLAFLPLPGWQAMVNFLVSAMVNHLCHGTDCVNVSASHAAT